MKILSKNIFLYLLLFPIIFNSLLNFFLNKTYKMFSFTFLISSISILLFLLTYVQIGVMVKKSLQNKTICGGFIIYILSFFILDTFFLLISKNFNSSDSFYIFNFIWLVFFISKKINILEIAKTIFLVIALNYFNSKYLNYLIATDIEILNSDVIEYWYPTLKNLFENNYFYTLDNSLIDGYGLLINYFQFVIYKIGIISNTFTMILTPVAAFFLMSMIFFSELKIKKSNKFLISILFFSFILNSEWLRFLFVESLMSESIISFVFLVLLTEFIYTSSNKLYFFFIGSLLISKQFVILIVFLIIIYIALKKRDFLGFVTSLIPYFVYKMNILFITSGSKVYDNYESVSVSTLFFNLNFSNLTNVINLVAADKVFIYFFIIFIIFSLLNFQNILNNEIEKVFFIAILLNLFFVLYLYISIWQNYTLGSSYRYILNTIHLMFASTILSFNQIQKK